jgi:uncharacterized membrane protein YsdA (DUF1294 family)
MEWPFAAYLLAINAVTFGAFGWDKYCAERQMYRVPEKTLLTLAGIGGALGGKSGQRLFRHKTRKEPFRSYLNWTVALNVAGLIALSSPEFRDRLLNELLR